MLLSVVPQIITAIAPASFANSAVRAAEHPLSKSAITILPLELVIALQLEEASSIVAAVATPSNCPGSPIKIGYCVPSVVVIVYCASTL